MRRSGLRVVPESIGKDRGELPVPEEQLWLKGIAKESKWTSFATAEVKDFDPTKFLNPKQVTLEL
jgi:hypothetical protein